MSVVTLRPQLFACGDGTNLLPLAHNPCAAELAVPDGPAPR